MPAGAAGAAICPSVLHLEDDPRDARLIQAHLALEGVECSVVRVEREAEFRSALADGHFDLILADHTLPDFDGMRALAIALESCPDIPFICVSGSLGEEPAIEALKNGATDYVLKHSLSRLAPAVRRALQESTERRKRRLAEAEVSTLEAQLRHSQKLEAVGLLAGGIAHDFNNLLTVINGYCERLLAAVDDESPIKADVDLVHQAGQRAAGLTRQLLAFGRRQVLQPRPVALNGVVCDIERILTRVLGEPIAVVTDLDPDLGQTLADPGQIEQVILNLAINGRDAMPDGGVLTIATRNIDGGANPLFGPSPGAYVMLSVSDTGHGMDPETAAHVFEPFFTTKAAGKGTGLGLSTVYGIVMQSHGHVDVRTAPGCGTTMRVYLPRVEAAAAEPAAAQEPARPDRGTETLLLVEDEDYVRELLRDFLTSAGYTVIEASSGEEALAIVEQRAPHLDLLVTDIVLSGINGAKLAERLKAQIPHLVTLYISGYPGDEMFGDAVFDPGPAFLAKPLTRHALTRKVRETLNGRPALRAITFAADPTAPLVASAVAHG